jgi:hypothetical protein
MNKFQPAQKLGQLGCMLATLCVWAAFARAQAPAPATPAEAVASRPCSANPVLIYTAKKKNAKQPKHPLPPEPAPACVEIKGDPLGIQEFLQNSVREQSWRMGENHASEDMWSFVRYFNPDELDTYADTKVLIEPVKFTSGKAAATVRTTDIGSGYTRVQISVHFQGAGKSTDSTWAQPATVWPLSSKGVLEKELVGALETRYKALD